MYIVCKGHVGSCFASPMLDNLHIEDQLGHEKTKDDVSLWHTVVSRCMAFSQVLTLRDWYYNHKECNKKIIGCRIHDLETGVINDFNTVAGCLIMKTHHASNSERNNSFLFESWGVMKLNTHKRLIFNVTIAHVSIALSTLYNGNCQKPNFIIYNMVPTNDYMICSNIGKMPISVFSIDNHVSVDHNSIMSYSDTMTLFYSARSCPLYLHAIVKAYEETMTIYELLEGKSEHTLYTYQQTYLWPKGDIYFQVLCIYLFSGKMGQTIKLSNISTQLMSSTYAYDGPGDRAPSLHYGFDNTQYFWQVESTLRWMSLYTTKQLHNLSYSDSFQFELQPINYYHEYFSHNSETCRNKYLFQNIYLGMERKTYSVFGEGTADASNNTFCVWRIAKPEVYYPSVTINSLDFSGFSDIDCSNGGLSILFNLPITTDFPVPTINLCKQSYNQIRQNLSLTGLFEFYLMFELYSGYSYGKVQALFTVDKCPMWPIFCGMDYGNIGFLVENQSACLSLYYIQQLHNVSCNGFLSSSGMSVMFEADNYLHEGLTFFSNHSDNIICLNNAIIFDPSKQESYMKPNLWYYNVQDVYYHLILCYGFFKLMVIRLRNITLESGLQLKEGYRFTPFPIYARKSFTVLCVVEC